MILWFSGGWGRGREVEAAADRGSCQASRFRCQWDSVKASSVFIPQG